MSTLSLLFAPLIALQGVGAPPVAVENDNPETWTLVYPRPLYRYVEVYRVCLRGSIRRVTGEPDFELQHRADVARCIEVQEDMVEQGYARLVERGDFQDFDEVAVRDIFDDVGRIHIARGADLDNQFTYIQRTMQLAQDEYESEKPKGLVLELHDASVVKARTDATAAAAEAARAQQEARGAND